MGKWLPSHKSVTAPEVTSAYVMLGWRLLLTVGLLALALLIRAA